MRVMGGGEGGGGVAGSGVVGVVGRCAVGVAGCFSQRDRRTIATKSIKFMVVVR